MANFIQNRKMKLIILVKISLKHQNKELEKFGTQKKKKTRPLLKMAKLINKRTNTHPNHFLETAKDVKEYPFKYNQDKIRLKGIKLKYHFVINCNFPFFIPITCIYKDVLFNEIHNKLFLTKNMHYGLTN